MLGFSSLILNWTRKYRIHSVSRYSSSLFFVLSPPLSLIILFILNQNLCELACLAVSLAKRRPIVPNCTTYDSLALNCSSFFSSSSSNSPPPPTQYFVSNLVSPSAGYNLGGGDSQNCTLTPMHLRKAKLMFFWVRYPSSAILKMYFPDIKFNKNNTAQLVKWFSNFR